MKNKTKVTDRRTRYTRQTIKDSFLTLLEEKPFSKITVTEICRISEINRGTFYLHYYDIDDVLDDLLNDVITDTSAYLIMCSARKNWAVPILSAGKFRKIRGFRSCFLMMWLLPGSWRSSANCPKKNLSPILCRTASLPLSRRRLSFIFR